MNLIILFLFAITASLASEVNVEKRWSKLEKSTLMECSYEKPVDYCLWATPYQPVMAFNSVTEQEIEDGRLKYVSTYIFLKRFFVFIHAYFYTKGIQIAINYFLFLAAKFYYTCVHAPNSSHLCRAAVLSIVSQIL